MASRTYTITGTLKTKQSLRGVAGFTVQAWDKDLLFDDALGSAVSDQDGGFRIVFTEARFRDLFGERAPDLYFRVFDPKGTQVASTEDSVLWNLAVGEIPIEILVALPETPAPIDLEPTQTFMVRGRIQQADATPFVGARVLAFDKDLRHEQTLGEQSTDAEGRYAISYGPHQFRRAEKQQADLIVRVLGPDGGLLAASPLRFNAPAAATVDLVIGGGALREASEYERLIRALVPVLDGAEPAALGADDTAFLTGETGEDPQRIGFVVQAHRLAAQTDLPPEAFNGLARRGLPTSLAPLLALPKDTWQRALEVALNENIVPLTLRARFDAVLERLTHLAEQAVDAGPGETPLPGMAKFRLRLDRLDDSLLTLLAAGGADRDYANETLNTNCTPIKRCCS